MIKLLTTTIVMMGGYCPQETSLHKDYITPYKIVDTKPIAIKEYISPTLNFDPWKDYNNKKNQELLDQIFLMELRNDNGK